MLNYLFNIQIYAMIFSPTFRAKQTFHFSNLHVACKCSIDFELILAT